MANGVLDFSGSIPGWSFNLYIFWLWCGATLGCRFCYTEVVGIQWRYILCSQVLPGNAHMLL